MPNKKKDLSHLNKSLECNFHNPYATVKNKKYCYLLESKVVNYLFNFVTLGLYGLVQWVWRSVLVDKYDQEIQKEQELFIKERFESQNIRGTNIIFDGVIVSEVNNSCKHPKQSFASKDKQIYLTDIAIKFFAVLITCGIYGIWLIYLKTQNTKLFNNLHLLAFSNSRQLEHKKNLDFLNKYQKEEKNIHKLNETLKQVNDFNLDDSIQSSISGTSNKAKRPSQDPFVLFLFYFSYFLLGVVTLGWFFVYIAVKKYVYKVDYNFFNYFLSKEVIDKNDFNKRIQELSNKFDEFDYSDKLIASVNSSVCLTNYDGVFKSFCFRHAINRFLSILFLSVITLGIFPIYVIYKLSFNTAVDYSFLNRQIKLTPVNFNEENWFLKKVKIKMKPIYDFGFDMHLITALSTQKILKITSDIDLNPKTKDFGIYFIKLITSPIFKWLFTLFLLLVNYLLASIWMMRFNYDLNNPIFYALAVCSLFFVLSLSYHISLFF